MMNEKATKIRRWVIGAVILGLLLAWYPMSIFPKTKNIPGLVVSLERRVASGYNMGSAYVISIYSNGTVLYFGKDNVALIGWRIGKINQEKIQQIIDVASEISFDDFKSEYLNSAASHDSITDISIRLNDHVKTIEYSSDPEKPENLRYLGELIDEIAQSEKYTKYKENCFLAPSICESVFWYWSFLLIPLIVAIEISWTLNYQGKYFKGLTRGFFVFIISLIILSMGYPWLLLDFLRNFYYIYSINNLVFPGFGFLLFESGIYLLISILLSLYYSRISRTTK